MQGKDGENNIISGISLALTFLIISGFVYFFPSYLGQKSTSTITSIVFLSLGVMGLGIELNKLAGKEKLTGMRDFMSGVILFLLWGVLHYYFPNGFISWILLIVLMLSIYGLISGIMAFLAGLLSNGTNHKKIVVKVSILFIQLTAVVAAILQSLQILRFIK